jgi:hypothetical protein
MVVLKEKTRKGLELGFLIGSFPTIGYFVSHLH